MSNCFVDLKDLSEKVSVEGAFWPGAMDFESETLRQIGPLGGMRLQNGLEKSGLPVH
jgi:hypothetical protein